MDDDATTDADLGQLIGRAIGRIHRRFRAERPAGELGDAAMTVLTVLHRQGPHTLSQLCERERVTAGSMSQTVNRLTAGGYAVRSADPADGRRVLFTATPKGVAVSAAARELRYAWFNARLGERSPADRAALERAAIALLEIADED